MKFSLLLRNWVFYSTPSASSCFCASPKLPQSASFPLSPHILSLIFICDVFTTVVKNTRCEFSIWIQCAVRECSVLCPVLCDTMDCSLPGSSVRVIFQARILEWVAIASSRGSFWPRDQTHILCRSCAGRQILYHYTTWEAPKLYVQCAAELYNSIFWVLTALCAL